MNTFKLYNQNGSIEYSKLAFGTSDMGYDDPEDAYARLDEYVRLGGRTIDTARVYSLFYPGDERPAERVVGEWLKRTGLRDQLQISTKGCHPCMFTWKDRVTVQDLDEDVATSLEELGTDHVEIYWLHRDDVKLEVGLIMEGLHKYVKQGVIKQIGASNWTLPRILEANAYAKAHGLTPFSASQIQWSYAKATPKDLGDETLISMDDATFAGYQAADLSVFAYSPQAKGFFSKFLALGEDGLPEKPKNRFLNDGNRAVNLQKVRNIEAFCKKFNVSPAVACLAYITCNPNLNAGAVIGASRIDQVQDSMNAANFSLTPEEFEYYFK